MAEKRNNKSKSKGTSFGKKSGAEKAFRGKKKSRTDDSFGGERRSASGSSSFTRPYRNTGGTEGRSDGFSKPRPESGTGEFKKPFQKREGGSFGARAEGPKRFSKPFRSEGSEERPFRKTGGSSSFGKPAGIRKSDSDFKRPFNREGGSSDSDKPRFSKPFRAEGGEERPFRKTGSSASFGKPGGFRKSDGDFKKPFRREKDSSDSSKPRFSKPFRSEGGEERPFRKTSSSPSFGKQGFGKSEGDFRRPFKRREEGASDAGSDKPKFSKPFSSEGDEKPFRKTTSASSSFGRPVKFEKPEGSKRYSDDFKKPSKESAAREGDSIGEEKPKRFEKKSIAGGEQKPFFQKRNIRTGGKSFKPKVWEDKPDDGLTRLNKYIANSGVCSRREADNLITMGLISVNKVTITELGYKVKQGDQVRYEDKLLKAEKPVYILLNKPKGFITTTDDPQERNTVMNLVATACKERIYPVGRLDRNTTGLLLLTNDGDLAEKLMHPSYKAKKIYKVELDKPLTKNDFAKIQEGVHLPEGKAIVDDLQMISDDSLTVGIEIHIGWNRVVRRIFESLGYAVVRLDRSVYAGLDKKEIGRGEWRFLKPEEIVKLKHFKG
jgi:23S rRNA pseudouridine2605 synthase